jgi:hypothetical protein
MGVALAQVDNGLVSAEAGYAERMHDTRTRWIEKITRQVEIDDGAGILENGLDLSDRELKNDLVNKRQRILNFGRGQVTKELKRQERTDG